MFLLLLCCCYLVRRKSEKGWGSKQSATENSGKIAPKNCSFLWSVIKIHWKIIHIRQRIYSIIDRDVYMEWHRVINLPLMWKIHSRGWCLLERAKFSFILTHEPHHFVCVCVFAIYPTIIFMFFRGLHNY